MPPLCWPPSATLSTAAVPNTLAGRIAAEIRSALAVSELQAEALAVRILKAIREPTKAMTEAGWDSVMLTPDDLWPTMIDAALVEH